MANDFGDGWEHDVVVEAIEPIKSGAVYPVCLGGTETAAQNARHRTTTSPP